MNDVELQLSLINTTFEDLTSRWVHKRQCKKLIALATSIAILTTSVGFRSIALEKSESERERERESVVCSLHTLRIYRNAVMNKEYQLFKLYRFEDNEMN